MILFIGTVSFSNIDQQQGLSGTDYLATSTDYTITSTVTSAAVEKSTVEPTHTILTPDVQKGPATMPSGFLLPLLQSADAVSSTQSTISINQWDFQNSGSRVTTFHTFPPWSKVPLGLAEPV